MAEGPSLEERARLLADAIGSDDGEPFTLLAQVASFARLAEGDVLPARDAWLVLDGAVEVDGEAPRVATRGDLVGWPPLLAARVGSLGARAVGEASVLVLERAATLEALLLDFELLLAVARPLAATFGPPLAATPHETTASTVERARRLRAIEPFDRIALDAVLEIAVQVPAISSAPAVLVRALAENATDAVGSDADVILDALEDHPRSALEVLAWLAERVEARSRA